MDAPRVGDVVRVDYRGTEGSEPNKLRWSIVVDAGSVRNLQTLLVVPCSSRDARRTQPTAVHVPAGAGGIPEDSVALWHLLFPASLTRLESGVAGNVGDHLLRQIRLVLADLLGIDAEVFLGDTSS